MKCSFCIVFVLAFAGCGNDAVSPEPKDDEPSSRCGDGIVDAGESCDDGNDDDFDACRNDCQVPHCGDGLTSHGEACDDGNSDDSDACSNACALSRCGDGVTSSDEQCDTAGDSVSCNFDCRAPTCGDGYVNTSFIPAGATSPEQCDDHNVTAGDGCSPKCRFERCGNNVVDFGEQCDGTAGPQPCSPLCRLPFCGNSYRDAGEECDDGNSTDADGCSSSCTYD